MKLKHWHLVVLRNVLGLAALLLFHYVSDRYYLHTRAGFRQISPYFFLLTLYGWIAFHNRVLFEQLYLHDRKKAYFGWTLLAMTVSTFNLTIILIYMFDANDVLPKVVSFWVYTFAGLGVFTLFTYLKNERKRQTSGPQLTTDVFACNVDGIHVKIPIADIFFVESYENYVKIVTESKTFLTRLPMKKAEERVPKDLFVRVSRSHIVNVLHITSLDNDSLTVHSNTLKIGKVYKRYVEEKMAAITSAAVT